MAQKDEIMKIYAPKSLESYFDSSHFKNIKVVPEFEDTPKSFCIVKSTDQNLQNIKELRAKSQKSKMVLWCDNLAELTTKTSLDQLLNFDVIAGPSIRCHVLNRVIHVITNTTKNGVSLIKKHLNGGDIQTNLQNLLGDLTKTEINHSKYKRHLHNICEELIMNAVKHAAHTDNKPQPYIEIIKTNDILEVEYCDYHGSFTKEKFFEYVGKMKHVGTKNLEIDSKEKGAGLGIIKMLHHCHSMIVCVKPNEQTKISCLIDTSETLKSPAMSPRIISYIEQ